MVENYNVAQCCVIKDECNDVYIVESFYECYEIFTFVWKDDGAAD